MGDAMLLGFQQMIIAERAGQTWLNSVPVVDGLLGELQQVAWKARVQRRWGDQCGNRGVQNRREGGRAGADIRWPTPRLRRDPWNTDPGQMKGHLISTYWCDSEPEDAPTIADVLERTLDVHGASVFESSPCRGCRSIAPDS